MSATKITSPDDPALDELCSELAALAKDIDVSGNWPAQQLQLCGEYGVFEWFVPAEWGGQGWDNEAVVRGYLALSGACLTTTFIITQRTGACRRIAGGENDALKSLLLPDLVRGASMATVGISHLTTSRRHLARPVLTAQAADEGFLLDGFSPWVTGAAHADHVVVGAQMLDEHGEPTSAQLLVAVPTDLPGVSTDTPAELIGVSASHTGAVRMNNVQVDERWVINGPVDDVLSHGVGAGTGGYQTSTLAIGLARSAIEFVEREANKRPDLQAPLDALREDYDAVHAHLMKVVRGEPDCSSEHLRQHANSLVLRASQATLVAAKGTGYVVGHPAGRWCREALFFLVWSCPQPVLSANLCELAGIAE